jgi:hypothetical protein
MYGNWRRIFGDTWHRDRNQIRGKIKTQIQKLKKGKNPRAMQLNDEDLFDVSVYEHQPASDAEDEQQSDSGTAGVFLIIF